MKPSHKAIAYVRRRARNARTYARQAGAGNGMTHTYTLSPG